MLGYGEVTYTMTRTTEGGTTTLVSMEVHHIEEVYQEHMPLSWSARVQIGNEYVVSEVTSQWRPYATED